MLPRVIENFDRVSKWIDSIGGESRGISRVNPDEREKSLTMVTLKVIGLWISGCGGLTSMSSYFLGPLIYGLGYKDTLVIGTLGTVFGCIFPAYLCIMGPLSGLRQMTSSRFLFGKYGVKFVALVTIVGFIGWSVTNSVLGGQILESVSNGKVPLEIGILLINLVSLVVSIFGINYVLKFESIIGILVIIVVVLMYIIGDNQITLYHDLQSFGDKSTVVGNKLGFFTLAFSVVSTWGGCASDYYILFPEGTSKTYLSMVTFFGILLPTILGAVIGMLIGNAAVGNLEWYSQYESGSIGGLLTYVFESRWGNFGKFLMVILWLSLITNNIINNYSSSLSVQLLDNFFYKYVPRWFISIILFVIVLICSLVGKNKFSDILSNFLPMLGYWIAIYFTLLVEENLIFRSTKLIDLYKAEFSESRNGSFHSGILEIPSDDTASKSSSEEVKYDSRLCVIDSQRSIHSQLKEQGFSKPFYNFDKWNDFTSLTYGLAAMLSFAIGVAGAVLGMAQVYYIGVLAAHLGDYGGDIGMWLAMGFCGTSYPILRYLELRKFGR